MLSRQLERAHNSRIAPNDTGNWQIYSPDQKTAMKARTDLMNLISAHPPTRFQPVDVDPFYHSYLRDEAARHVRDTHGVRLVVPDGLADSPVLLVYESRVPSPEYEMPRRQPTAQEVQDLPASAAGSSAVHPQPYEWPPRNRLEGCRRTS